MSQPVSATPLKGTGLPAQDGAPGFQTPTDPKKFRVKGDPYTVTTTDEVIVGNPTVLKELTRLIPAHGTSQEPIRTLTPWDAVKMPVTTHIIGGLNLNGDAYADFLLIRSFEIYVEPQANPADHKTISFLIKVPGSEAALGKEEPTIDMIKQGVILAVATHAGSSHPITDVAVSQSKKAGQTDRVTYRLYDAAAGKYVDRTVPTAAGVQTIEAQYATDRALFDALFDIQAYVFNSLGYLVILQGAEFSKGIKAAEQASKSATQVTHLLNAPLMQLASRYEVVAGDPMLREYYTRQDPDLLPFMKAMAKYAKEELLFSKADTDKVIELATNSEKLMTQALENFRWEGKRLTRAEFYQALREIEDPAKRRELVESYSQVVLNAHRHGLFPMIDELNLIAQKYGYENYAEYVGHISHGIAPSQFDRQAKAYHAANEAKLKAFVAELTELNGGKTVYEWDVHHLADKLAQQKLDGQKIPKLTFADALEAARRFFKDIGIDLDQPPFQGNIFYDTNKRQDKYGNAFAMTIGDGSRAWFNTNFDTTEKISLEDLGTIVHELVHDIHMIQSAKRARGNVAMAIDGNPSIWTEGIAVAVDRLVMTKEWMDRYLAHLPQFSDPAVRSAIAEANEGLAIYDQMMIMSRARFEINLYQVKNKDGSERPLEERLNFWPEWVRKYMHVEAMEGTKGGRVYATPHFAGSPGYYVSYTGGFQTALKATEEIYEGLKKGDEALLKSGGATLLHLFEMGARLTNIAEIESEIDAWRGQQ